MLTLLGVAVVVLGFAARFNPLLVLPVVGVVCAIGMPSGCRSPRRCRCSRPTRC